MTKWDDRYMAQAWGIATWSKDPTTGVGCKIVGPDREPLSEGFNGLPRGVEDLPQRMERPAKYLWTKHAEANAICNATRSGTKLMGATAYVTHHPCSQCAGALIQAGVSRVVIGPGQTSMPSEEFAVAATMFREAGLIVHHNATNRSD